MRIHYFVKSFNFYNNILKYLMRIHYFAKSFNFYKNILKVCDAGQKFSHQLYTKYYYYFKKYIHIYKKNRILHFF